MFKILYHPLGINYFSLLSLVSIGMMLRRYKIISADQVSFLNELSLKVMLPLFILVSFMTDPDPSLKNSGIPIMIWGISIHGVLLLGAYFYYNTVTYLTKDDKILLRNILPMGAASSFGVAAAVAFYGNTGAFVSNIYNLTLRIFLYTVCLVSISGSILTKKSVFTLLKTPAVLASLLGISIFFFQEYTYQVTINGISTSIFRIDHSLPFLYSPLKKIGSMFPTLVWIIIGCAISKENLEIMRKSPIVLRFIWDKCFMVPLISVCLFVIIRKIGFTIDNNIVPILLLMSISPPANVLVALSMKHKRSDQLCIACFVSCTIICIFLLPIYYIILQKLF